MVYSVQVYGERRLRQVTANDLKTATKIAKQRYGVIRYVWLRGALATSIMDDVIEIKRLADEIIS